MVRFFSYYLPVTVALISLYKGDKITSVYFLILAALFTLDDIRVKINKKVEGKQ